MKGKTLKALIVSLIASMLIFIPVMAAPQTAQTAEAAVNDSYPAVTINVKYHVQKARDMLKLVNNFRSTPNWIFNDNDRKITDSAKPALKYDYYLEEIAMQRAAETAIHWDHARPDGGSKPGVSGENIAANSAVPSDIAGYTFNQWKEDDAIGYNVYIDEKYMGDGHRRNMRNADFKSIGIACVEKNGHLYSVQLFSRNEPKKTTTTITNSVVVKDVSFKINPELGIEVEENDITSLKSIQDIPILTIGASKDFSKASEIKVNIKTTETYPDYFVDIKEKTIIQSSNSNVVSVNGSKITAKAAGTAVISFVEPINRLTLHKIRVTVPPVDIGITDVNGTKQLTYNNGETIYSNFTGLTKDKDGKWYYFVKGVQDKKYNGTSPSAADPTKTASGKYPVKNGEWNSTYTGLSYSKEDDTWYYFTNGRHDTKYVGTSPSTAVPEGQFFVKNGIWDTSYTGLAYSGRDKTWYYMTNGRHDKKYVGTSPSTAVPEGQFFVKNGVWDTSYTGLAYSGRDKTWYYVTNGRHDKKYVGTSPSTAVPEGQFFVKNGVWDTSYTGLAYSGRDKTWYYVTNGRHDTKYVGTSPSTAVPEGQFFVKNGIWDTSYTGLAYSGRDKTWYYVTNGRHDTKYVGLSSSTTNSNKVFYVKSGKWQKEYTGQITLNSKKYNIKNGKVV